MVPDDEPLLLTHLGSALPQGHAHHVIVLVPHGVRLRQFRPKIGQLFIRLERKDSRVKRSFPEPDWQEVCHEVRLPFLGGAGTPTTTHKLLPALGARPPRPSISRSTRSTSYVTHWHRQSRKSMTESGCGSVRPKVTL